MNPSATTDSATPSSAAPPSAAPRYDPFDPAFQADPYPTYRRLRDLDPVHRHDGDGTEADPAYWVLSRYEDINRAVRTPEVFSSAHGLTFFADEIGKLGLAPTIVMMDPPEHSLKRRLISKAFSPRRVAEAEGSVRGFVRERLGWMRERAAAGEAVDLHRDFSSTVPTFLLSHLLGIPEADRHLMDPWVHALVTVQDSGFALDGLDAGAAGAVGGMFEYFGQSVAERRRDLEAGRDPGGDLVTALLRAEVDGERLTDWDVLGFCFVIVAGGNDTSGNLVSHTVALLDAHPEQRAALVADPGLVPDALTECLRFESSVQGLARQTLADVVVGGGDGDPGGGVTIPAGEKVMMLYGSGNRDERHFGPTADVLDIRRDNPGHLAFGSGPHFCIGSHFAKMQSAVAIQELYAAFPTIGVDAAAAQRVRSPFTRGFTSLPATGLDPLRNPVRDPPRR